MKSKNKFYILLAAIFFLGLMLRLVFTSSVPPSLNWDEASLGYNAFSILKTGKDEWGKFLPISFEAFGDYKLPGYIYVLVPFIAIFGLTDFSVRLPSILFGSLSVVFLYLIVLELTKNKKWAILSSFLLAISPWHFFLSRIALEANLALSFFLAGFYLLIKGTQKSLFLILASILFGISIFTYNSARIFVPLFPLSFILLYRQKLKINFLSILSLIIFSIFIIFGFYFAVFQDSSSRYYWVRILDEGAISFLEESRNNSPFNNLITQIIYNRYIYFSYSFLLGYFKHLSVQFLALTGGSNYQFSLQNFGIIYLIELPFLLFGFYKLLKEKLNWIFLLWILIAPIPASLTRESPHVLRSIFMLGAIQIITAFGFLSFINLLKKSFVKSVCFLALVLLLINLGIYLHNYFYEYPYKYSQSWQYGYKGAVEKVIENYDKYPKIFFTKKYGEPHIFYLLYSKYDPYKFQENQNLVRYANSNWRWVDKLDKIYFINDWEISEKLKNENNALVITSPDSLINKGNKIETIYFLDGGKAFEIIEI